MWINSAEHGVRLIASTLLQRFLSCPKGTVHLQVFHQIADEMSKGQIILKEKKKKLWFLYFVVDGDLSPYSGADCAWVHNIWH